MNNKKLQNYKETLLKEKERVTNLIDELQDDTPFGDIKHPTSERYSTGELSAYDNHPGDMGSEVFMHEMQMNLANQHKYRADVIDRALVHKWNIKVPIPALIIATEGSNPVRIGTNTVAPNIDSKC